jgi:hypothetical protein
MFGGKLSCLGGGGASPALPPLDETLTVDNSSALVTQSGPHSLSGVNQ